MGLNRILEILCIKRCAIGIFLLGSVLLVIGGVFFGLFDSLGEKMIQKNLVLSEDSENYKKWEVTPIPVYLSMYLFNVTNPYEVEHLGKKPILQEVGPYVYEERRSKNVLSWDFKNSTVTYDDIKTFVFLPNISADPEAMIYTLNMPMLGMSQFIRKLGYFIRNVAASALDDLLVQYEEGLFIHKPARILLFEGYKVQIIEDLISLVKPFVKVPEILPNNTFGFLYGKNNTGDGIFTVNTGADDFHKYTQIMSWNNNSKLGWWQDEYCDMLNGTDGAQFPPPIGKNDVLYVYVAELCRSIFLEFQEEVNVKGIKAYRFTTPARMFESPTIEPNNQCYCTRPEYCELSGILDITRCRKGIPLGITGPHFYQAHEEIIKRVEGLKPDPELHATHVDIEPMTGVVLSAARKLQMNYLMERYSGLKFMSKVSNAIFPLLWLSESAEVDDELASMFTAKVKTPLTIAKSVLTACIVLGLLWIATAGVVTVYILIKQQKAAKSTVKAHYKAVPQRPEDIGTKSEKQTART